MLRGCKDHMHVHYTISYGMISNYINFDRYGSALNDKRCKYHAFEQRRATYLLTYLNTVNDISLSCTLQGCLLVALCDVVIAARQRLLISVFFVD